MPVAGVGDHDAWPLSDTDPLQLPAGAAHHRCHVTEVRGVGVDLGGEHDLIVGDDHLHVGALDVSARALDVL